MKSRRQRAMEMRLGGASFREIADKLGVLIGTARCYTDPTARYHRQRATQKYRRSPRGRMVTLLAASKQATKRYGWVACTATVEELLASYTGKCTICGASEKIHMDHCHVTGRFRGWLCIRCNMMLGAVNDDVGLLKGMINYLRKYGS